MSDLLWQDDAYALSGKLRTGEFTVVECLEHYLTRIQAINPTLNAVICLNENAMADARASATRYAEKRPLSPMDGVPIVIKDNLVVRGMPTTWGSRLYENHISKTDEIPVEKLRHAGCVIVGKTNVPEFTVEGYTDNELFGVTRNPWDLSKTPGGSSGGSVAAVAAGLSPVAIGTDGGGSIRRPASYTNLVGLKPSIGRVPRGGGLPQVLLDMEVVGPLTRSVRDQAMLFDLLAQPDPRDHRSVMFDGANSLRQLDIAPKPLKIRVVETFANAPLDPEIRTSFRHMVDVMQSMGHHVESGDLPLDILDVNENWVAIADIGLGLLLERIPEMRQRASQKYIERAQQKYPAHQLLDTLELITDLRNQAAQVFEDVDLLMTPTCAAMPWATGIDFPPEIDGQAVGPRGSAVYTGWVNACGHPAISVPGKASKDDMPIGIQFVGGFGQEPLLLRLARQIEIAQNWNDQWPEIAGTDIVNGTTS